jgi:hypothetical protein
VYSKEDKKSKILSFASYSKGLFAKDGIKESEEVRIDYSNIDYSKDPETLLEIGR